MSALSDQYAVALFELGLENDSLNDLKVTYESFIPSLDQKTMEFFLHPKISKNDKKALIKQFDLPELFRDFLYVLIDNNRFDYVKEIYQGLHNLMINLANQMVVKVYSKENLSKAKVTEIQSQFERKYNRNVLIENVVDQTIVGGLKYEFAGVVLDNTINNNLNLIKSHLGN
ncbi:MAG: ATP synthase F1 subunit delta [Candidatus Izemoplasmataceae bacterium]